MNTRISNREFALSVITAILAASCMSLTGLFGKELTTFSSLSLVVFIRFFAPFLILTWICLVVFDENPVTHRIDRIDGARALFTCLAQYCLFYYLSKGSLLVAALLFSTSGLFLPFITRFAKKDPIKKKTLAACLISFIGVAFILKPIAGFDSYMIVGLLSGFFGACSQFVMHHSSKKQNTISSTTKMFGLSSLYMLAILLIEGNLGELTKVAVSLSDSVSFVIVIIAFSLSTISNQSLRTKAYRRVNRPASLSPYLYTSLIFSGILDWLVYNTLPTWNTYAGSLLIVIGGIIQAIRTQPQIKASHS
ncbi:DMT family transporter [Microbulbifer sp. TRSA007]|uniref:DMT family transporter n=1 Tax=Microbulbifer sp. TRSA007 TaxID=3243384 RepID=UPI0040396B0E